MLSQFCMVSSAQTLVTNLIHNKARVQDSLLLRAAINSSAVSIVILCWLVHRGARLPHLIHAIHTFLFLFFFFYSRSSRHEVSKHPSPMQLSPCFPFQNVLIFMSYALYEYMLSHGLQWMPENVLVGFSQVLTKASSLSKQRLLVCPNMAKMGDIHRQIGT